MLRFALAQSDVSEGRIREHTVGNQPIARAAVAAGEIVPDDPKIIVGYVRKLRTAGTFAHGPDIGCRCLKPLIDANVATGVQLDAGPVRARSRRCWERAPSRPRCRYPRSAARRRVCGR